MRGGQILLILHLRLFRATGKLQVALSVICALLMLGVMPTLTAAVSGRQAQVSPRVADLASKNEPVEALLLLDDTAEQAAEQIAALHKVEVYQADLAEYKQRMVDRQARLDSLKDKVKTDLAGADLEILHDYSLLPILHVHIKSAGALNRITRHGKVLSVDENTPNKHFLSQSLPLINQQQASTSGYRGGGATVAVLDTGVDYTRVAFGSCTAPGGACKVVYATDFAPADSSLDDNGHGTNVAGITLGVAPDAKIAALDVFRTDGYAYTSDIVSAINWCVTNKATYNIASINMSLGSGRYYSAVTPADSWGYAIQSAVNAGIVVVAAAGNDAYKDSIAVPGAYANVVSVGAVYDSNVGRKSWAVGCTDTTTRADNVTCFSNSASFLTLLAPGSVIDAAGISMSGTSQASPHVAGAVAVLRAAYPADTVSAIKNKLLLGTPVTDTNGISKPRLDLMQALSGTPVTVPGAPTIGTATAGNGQATVSFTAPVSDGGSAITSYTVTSTPGNKTATGTSSPIIVSGLTNGIPYTFSIVATNVVGSSAASAASNSVTPRTVPGAPAIGTATAGDAQATVGFTAPASDGGSAIVSYTATSNPGGITASLDASPITVTGLTNGIAYTFTVTATNAVGAGAASTASNSVTPHPLTCSISGNAGVAGASLSYADGAAKTANADGNGNYSITVSYNWSGTVTPSKAYYTFSPANKAYANLLASQTTQDYTATSAWLDLDADGVVDIVDNCPDVYNPGQLDSDHDAMGDVCDSKPTTANYGSVIDAPHNETRGITCGDCHSYSLWWQQSPVAASSSPSYAAFTNAVCAKCHAAATHASVIPGGFSVKCVDCHSAHEQAQVDWRSSDANDLYLVKGTITGSLAVDGGQTTFNYSLRSAPPDEWIDPATWGKKNTVLPPRGLILVVDAETAANTFEVVSATATTITIKGGIDPALAGTSFGLIYGQMIKKSITTTMQGKRDVRFFNPQKPGGGFTDSNTPVTGICQVCHINTVYWTSDGGNTGHHSAEGCTNCHTMAQGFKP